MNATKELLYSLESDNVNGKSDPENAAATPKILQIRADEIDDLLADKYFATWTVICMAMIVVASIVYMAVIFDCAWFYVLN